MTAKAEVPPKLARQLLRAVEARETATEREGELLLQAVEASGVNAVARLLGISRQAVQQRLAVARAARA